MISTFFNQVASHPFLTTGAVVIGLASYPLIKRITKVAISAIKAFSSWLWNSTFIVRIRSLGCYQCTLQHKFHSELKNSINKTANENLAKDRPDIEAERD